MTISTNITASDSCKVTVQDLSVYRSESATGTVLNDFKESETLSIYVLRWNKVMGETVVSTTFVPHDGSVADINIPNNGWFTIISIIIPTKEWFEEEKAKEASSLSLYDIVYYSDGESIYKYIDGTSSTVDISEIIEVNTTGTTLETTEDDYVSICQLRECYVDYCKQILNSGALSSCFDNTSVDNDLTYKRDLAWMVLNVIRYLTECELLVEAERIIEKIDGCQGLCSSDTTTNTSGCGCSN